MTLFSQTDRRNRTLEFSPGLVRIAAGLKLYVVAAVLCVLILTYSLKLWRLDIHRPLDYWGDSIMVQIWNKTIYEFGWYLKNPRLGAPYTMHMGDFPMADGLHQGIYKGLGWITPNYVVALNLFFLATFPLTTLTALYVSRKLGLGSWTAVTCSLLYAFLPYHFLRQIAHLYLASYYVVPLSILVIYRIYTGEVGIFAAKETQDTTPTKPRLWGSLLICVLQGCAGVYYGFFACYLLLISAGMSAVQRRSAVPIFTAILFIAVTTSSLLVNLTPHLLYRLEHGSNPAIATRRTIEPEVHGLKIAQLILPSFHHPIKQFAGWTWHYMTNSVSTSENSTSTLGLVGCFGFFMLVFLLWVPGDRSNQTLRVFSILTIFSVLLCTIGGFSSLFSLFVTPLIRGYNRISVYIAFFSIFTTCLLLEWFSKSLAERGYHPWVFRSLVCAVLAVGILDQVPAKASRLYTKNTYSAARWQNDVDFFGRVEASMPENALIFQYPHMTFPEGEWPEGVLSVDPSGAFHHTSYDHGRGYLHTKTLRWSFPIRGRYVDTVFQEMSQKPLPDLLKTLALGEFSGIYIYRRACPDYATELEANLRDLLGASPLVSRDTSMSFFDMRDYADRLKESMSPEVWTAEKEAVWGLPRATGNDRSLSM
jgi:hypothetical protein